MRTSSISSNSIITTQTAFDFKPGELATKKSTYYFNNVWPSNTSPTRDSAIWTGSRYVVAGYQNISTFGTAAKLVSSTDGVTWTDHTVVFGPDGADKVQSIAYNGTTYVATAFVGLRVSTSTDLTTWTDVSSNLVTTVGMNYYRSKIIWNGTYFICIGSNGTTNFARSTNGASWTGFGGMQQTLNQASSQGATDFGASAIAYNGSKLMVIGGFGICTYSPDSGSTWTYRSDFYTKLGYSTLGHSIAYGNGIWVYCANNQRYMTSTDDGATWTNRSGTLPGGGSISQLTFTGTHFIGTDPTNSSTTLYYSTDGINWTVKYNSLPNVSANYAMAYSTERNELIVVGQYGDVVGHSLGKASWLSSTRRVSPRVWDRAKNAAPVFTNLPAISTTIKKFGPASIDLPYTSTASELYLSGTTSGMTITVEMWKYIDVSPGSFDPLFELYNDPSNNVFVDRTGGSIRGNRNGSGFLSGFGASWTDVLNEWVHFVLTINLTTGAIVVARNGVRSASVGNIGGAFGGTPSRVRFKDSVYGGIANGYVDDIRVSTGDVYNLFNTTTYTVPTASLPVIASTLHLFSASYPVVSRLVNVVNNTNMGTLLPAGATEQATGYFDSTPSLRFNSASSTLLTVPVSPVGFNNQVWSMEIVARRTGASTDSSPVGLYWPAFAGMSNGATKIVIAASSYSSLQIAEENSSGNGGYVEIAGGAPLNDWVWIKVIKNEAVYGSSNTRIYVYNLSKGTWIANYSSLRSIYYQATPTAVYMGASADGIYRLNGDVAMFRVTSTADMTVPTPPFNMPTSDTKTSNDAFFMTSVPY